jgi:hypothetical protein
MISIADEVQNKAKALSMQCIRKRRHERRGTPNRYLFQYRLIEDHWPFVNLQLNRVQRLAIDSELWKRCNQEDEIRSIDNLHVARAAVELARFQRGPNISQCNNERHRFSRAWIEPQRDVEFSCFFRNGMHYDAADSDGIGRVLDTAGRIAK